MNRAAWAKVFKECRGDVFKVVDLTGALRAVALKWRRRFYGNHWTKKGSVKSFTPDQVEELRAALLAKISPVLMAHRFGCSEGTLRLVIKYYDLPRIRKPRTPKQPSKVW